MDNWDPLNQEPARTEPVIAAMHIRQEHHIDAPRQTVWELLTRRIDAWWSHPYRVQDRDSTMRLQIAPHGSLTEHWEHGGFATWGQVSHIDPGHTLELTGPCGMGAVHGVYTFHLQDREGGVVMTLTHDAFGPMRDDVTRVFEDAWQSMLTRIKALAEGQLAYGADARTI